MDATLPPIRAYTNTATAALPTAVSGNPQRIADAAKEFEAVFISTMLNQMFAGIRTDGPFGGGHGEEQFRGLLVEEYGKAIADAGGFGLADAVRRELIAIQEENAP